MAHRMRWRVAAWLAAVMMTVGASPAWAETTYLWIGGYGLDDMPPPTLLSLFPTLDARRSSDWGENQNWARVDPTAPRIPGTGATIEWSALYGEWTPH